MNSTSSPFNDTKRNTSVLSSLEARLSHVLAASVPVWMESHHLTMLTALWSLLAIAVGIMAKRNEEWLWWLSVIVALQYVTDAVDGKIGKQRRSGLERWGYYMDHLLDYVFLISVLFCYTVLLPDEYSYIILPLIAISSGFMVTSFLAHSTTGKLTISHFGIGPVEIRIVFIAINTWLVTAGRSYMIAVVPYVLGLSMLALCVVVYRTQRDLWKIDFAETTAALAVSRRRFADSPHSGVNDRGESFTKESRQA